MEAGSTRTWENMVNGDGAGIHVSARYQTGGCLGSNSLHVGMQPESGTDTFSPASEMGGLHFTLIFMTLTQRKIRRDYYLRNKRE